MLGSQSPVHLPQEENVEAQLDRLNEAIAKTLEEAKKATEGGDPDFPHHTHTNTEESALQISNYDVNLSDVMYTEPGVYSAAYSYESDFQEYVESLELLSERALMRMEDLEGRLGGTREQVIVGHM